MARTNIGETSARVVVGAGTREVCAELTRATAGRRDRGHKPVRAAAQGRSAKAIRVKGRRGEQTGAVPQVTSQMSHVALVKETLPLSTHLLTTPPQLSLSSHLSNSRTPGYGSICSRTGLCPLALSLPLTALSTGRATNSATNPYPPPWIQREKQQNPSLL